MIGFERCFELKDDGERGVSMGSQQEAYTETSPLDGFLISLRQNGIRVSTPEWLQFLTVVRKDINKELLVRNDLLDKVRLFARITLIKNKTDEAVFHEVFDRYFSLKQKESINDSIDDSNNKEGDDSDKEIPEKLEEEVVETESQEPEIKDKLGIKEVDENLDQLEGEHDNDEQVHGGNRDQHNDILRRQNLNKRGGGNKKEGSNKDDGGESGAGKENKGNTSGMGKDGTPGDKEGEQVGRLEIYSPKPQTTVQGFLTGDGKGKSIMVDGKLPIIKKSGDSIMDTFENRKKVYGVFDRRRRYEVRPNKVHIQEVIRSIRRIIIDVSSAVSRSVDIPSTVVSFARKNFRFKYETERNNEQQEIVLFIDVGGPVDEWSPLVKELAESMAKGLTKLEIYLFHNNLYGYVWKPDPKDLLASSYPGPNSLIDLKKIIKRRKKVIIYGDAEMSYSEFQSDFWKPEGNNKKVGQFGMNGEKCLKFIEKTADSVVWINPIFKKEWAERDESRTIEYIQDIIPMYDLTIGGVEDAVRKLMKK